MALAPAFAGITATWIDRNAALALTTAANWAGSTRASEIDPTIKTAMRVAAASAIDLTRLYVRLWALALSSLQAEAADLAYTPRATNNYVHVVRDTFAYQDWAAALNLSVTSQQQYLYFDANSLEQVDDILPTLALATANSIESAGFATRFWPPIHGLQLLTNTRNNISVIQHTHYTAILATINWLVLSTSTPSQSNDALGLVLSMCYRPLGCGLLPESDPNMVTNVSLPAFKSLGQLLLPLSLWATTVDPSDNSGVPNLPSSNWLRLAATTSATYYYTLAQALCVGQPPSWWDDASKELCRRNASAHLAITSDGWAPALRAANIRHQLQIKYGLPATNWVYPNSLRHARALAATQKWSCMEVLPFITNPLTSDVHVAKFSKIKIAPAPDFAIGLTMRIEQLNPGVPYELTAPSLAASGAQVGYALIAKHTNFVVGEYWQPASYDKASLLIPKALPSWTRAVAIVRFASLETYLNTRANVAMMAATAWSLYTATNNYDDNGVTDGSFSADEQHQFGNGAIPSAQTLPATPTQPMASDPGDDDDEIPIKAVAPPLSIENIRDTDQIIAAALETYTTHRPIARDDPAITTLPHWQIPKEILEDAPALAWLANMLPHCFALRDSPVPQATLQQVVSNLDEQYRLHLMRAASISAARNVARASWADETEGSTETSPSGPQTNRQTTLPPTSPPFDPPAGPPDPLINLPSNTSELENGGGQSTHAELAAQKTATANLKQKQDRLATETAHDQPTTAHTSQTEVLSSNTTPAKVASDMPVLKTLTSI
jgi:hypothetical protein